jgi:uncharacterized FAD-dependent dehydrogenase
MKLIINNIRLSLDDGIEQLKHAAAKKLRIRAEDLKNLRIIKKSIDARRKQGITLVYSVIVEIEKYKENMNDSDIRVYRELEQEALISGNIKLNNRPVIIGSGPAGLFAGLLLSQNGYRPYILERGECVEERSKTVQRYWETGELDLESNIQFGEGGAGTFSDGKLTTRINDHRCNYILEKFHEMGAHEEILYKSRPHVGSDVLKNVLINMRRKIESFGGKMRFKSKVTSLNINNGKITGVIVNGNEEIDTDVVILAIGHSARDTFETLLKQGIRLVQKPFSIGVRIEHPQQLINRAQYGELAGHPKLSAADYQLFYKTGARTVYSFCMCPGGIVVAAASEPCTIVTNGMSEFARDRENANSALVVSVGPEDFGGTHPLAGIEFQRKWEKRAFDIAGKNNSAPVQRLEDFVRGAASNRLGTVRPSYTGQIELSDINLCLPEFITNPMKESIGYFDSKIKGFGMDDAILTGVETRTSSPVRIPRDGDLEAIGIKGLYPAGEGAGYAGGIVSAAVDGLRVAEQIIRTYAPPKNYS